MRKFNSILVIALLLISGTIAANNKPGSEKSEKKLATQVSELLKINSFGVDEQGSEAEVLFTLNENKEIVVLSVKTNNQELEAFVKGKLNYQKVVLSDYREGRTYKLPVRIAD